MTHSRRMAHLLLGLATSAFLAAGASAQSKYVEPKITHAPFGDVKIVVPITVNDSKVWAFKMANIRNALDASAKYQGSASVRVVVYGPGIELLKQSDNETATALDDLRKRGVVVDVCNNTLRFMDIDYRTLHAVSESDVVPSGFLEVAWLQQQGFHVDPGN